MKNLLPCVAVCACLSVSAGEVVVSAGEPSAFCDSEASTNVAFNVGRNDVRRFDMLIDLEGTVSNCVQVAFGRDADGDGDLDLAETDLLLGWWGGRYFVEDGRASARSFADSASGTNRFLAMRVATDRDYVPKSASFANEVGECFGEVASACPPWLFRADWNLLKVTRRGVAPSHDVFCINNVYRKFHIIVR